MALTTAARGGSGRRGCRGCRVTNRPAHCRVSTDEDYGTPSFAIEAMIEALTASELYLGHGNHAPAISGAEECTFVGMIAPGYGAVGRP